ncbi:MAG: MBL fold metallo-hydrolase [Gemmatimonadota bacterium]
MTWVGHSTFLIQLAGINLLTDPVWSLRASPFQWLGPARMTAPGIAFEELPRIDAVLLTHDHYDHLDSPTVRRLAHTHPKAPWYAPLGHVGILQGLGVQTVVELDWWQRAALLDADGFELVCLPVQHWTRRFGSPAFRRLWCSWAIKTAGCSIYFAGDSGYCPAFREIGERAGPFDVAILPIGAYEPRWFMQPAHMNPEEALQSYTDLRAREFIAMHWGTFRLTDEDPLEPPTRIRSAWQQAQLPAERLHVPAFGETIVFDDACRP